jgi:hypothetical protein
LGWSDGCWATTRDKIQIRDGKKVIFPKGWKKIYAKNQFVAKKNDENRVFFW